MNQWHGTNFTGSALVSWCKPARHQGNRITMSNDDLISLCGAVRTSIDTLHELASGIDADIGRRQIYGEADAINRALERTRALATTIELLETQLFDCATPTIERPRNSLEETNSSREAA